MAAAACILATILKPALLPCLAQPMPRRWSAPQRRLLWAASAGGVATAAACASWWPPMLTTLWTACVRSCARWEAERLHACLQAGPNGWLGGGDCPCTNCFACKSAELFWHHSALQHSAFEMSCCLLALLNAARSSHHSCCSWMRTLGRPSCSQHCCSRQGWLLSCCHYLLSQLATQCK